MKLYGKKYTCDPSINFYIKIRSECSIKTKIINKCSFHLRPIEALSNLTSIYRILAAYFLIEIHARYFVLFYFIFYLNKRLISRRRLHQWCYVTDASLYGTIIYYRLSVLLIHNAAFHCSLANTNFAFRKSVRDNDEYAEVIAECHLI